MRGRGLGLTIVLGFLAVAPELAKGQTGSRLSGPEVSQLLTGKTVVFRHDRNIRGSAEDPEVFARTDGVVSELTVTYRGDGSFRRLCRFFAPSGNSGPCGGVLKDVSTGVWEIRGGGICQRDLIAAGSREACFEIERAGLRYRWRYVGAKLVRGPFNSLIDGLEFDVRP
jgi:hypothetical protein